jgi:hypothetical protein
MLKKIRQVVERLVVKVLAVPALGQHYNTEGA